MKRLLIVSAALVIMATPAGAQQTDDRLDMALMDGGAGAAVVEALAFASPLAADSIIIDGCRLRERVGPDGYAVVAEALGHRLREPGGRSRGEGRCPFWERSDTPTTRIYVGPITEVRRARYGSDRPARLSLEIDLNLDRGPGFRTYRVTLKPWFRDDEGGRTVVWSVDRFELIRAGVMDTVEDLRPPGG